MKQPLVMYMCLKGSTVIISPYFHLSGSPALTSRGIKEEDIRQVMQFLHEGIEITQQAKTRHEAALNAASTNGEPPAKPTIKVYMASLIFATLNCLVYM